MLLNQCEPSISFVNHFDDWAECLFSHQICACFFMVIGIFPSGSDHPAVIDREGDWESHRYIVYTYQHPGDSTRMKECNLSKKTFIQFFNNTRIRFLSFFTIYFAFLAADTDNKPVYILLLNQFYNRQNLNVWNVIFWC